MIHLIAALQATGIGLMFLSVFSIGLIAIATLGRE